jgi:hypothetical protein
MFWMENISLCNKSTELSKSWKVLFQGMWCCEAWKVCTNNVQQHTASVCWDRTSYLSPRVWRHFLPYFFFWLCAAYFRRALSSSWLPSSAVPTGNTCSHLVSLFSSLYLPLLHCMTASTWYRKVNTLPWFNFAARSRSLPMFGVRPATWWFFFSRANG